MFRSFEGPTAAHVWQQLVEAFRAGDGLLVQPSRGGVTKEFLPRCHHRQRPQAAMGSFPSASAECRVCHCRGCLDHHGPK